MLAVPRRRSWLHHASGPVATGGIQGPPGWRRSGGHSGNDGRCGAGLCGICGRLLRGTGANLVPLGGVTKFGRGFGPSLFFRSRRRPTPGHTMAHASAVPPRRPCRQAGPHGPPRRPGPGLSPLGVSLAAALWPSSGPKGMRRHENCPACPGRPPPGSGPRWLVVVGAW